MWVLVTYMCTHIAIAVFSRATSRTENSRGVRNEAELTENFRCARLEAWLVRHRVQYHGRLASSTKFIETY